MQSIITGFTHEQVQSACDEINVGSGGVKLRACTYELRGINPKIVHTIEHEQAPCDFPKEIIDAMRRDMTRDLWVMIYRNGTLAYNLPARDMNESHRNKNYRSRKRQYACDCEPTLKFGM